MGLNPAVGYQAIEILERFMARYIEDLIHGQKDEGASSEDTERHEELVFQTLKQKFFLSVVSSVQISSKLDLYSNVVNNDIAMRFVQAAGRPSSKQQLLDSEILILKTLHFNVNVPNPLTYVETLLEVLGHNDGSVRVAELHQVCVRVLRFIYLQREIIYSSLLVSATGCSSPSPEQRAKFVSVSEDLMLLGVGVIAVSAFIHHSSTWEKVVEELTGITGISGRSIMEFVCVTLMHITKTTSE
ncbi:cyclin N-terminal domain-containing 1 [Labeo rohita]|uniref:Cyclin N-terminal domain-containing 1 n=1 Tax=Labeo rohita TaxID=84645 RepID=A0A498MWC9_LABRO|nr:cyclin N-terminal domain-containing 1 [Labeo rohita]